VSCLRSRTFRIGKLMQSSWWLFPKPARLNSEFDTPPDSLNPIMPPLSCRLPTGVVIDADRQRVIRVQEADHASALMPPLSQCFLKAPVDQSKNPIPHPPSCLRSHTALRNRYGEQKPTAQNPLRANHWLQGELNGIFGVSC